MFRPTNCFSSASLNHGAQIVHIESGEDKQAFSNTKHNYLFTQLSTLLLYNSVIPLLLKFLFSFSLSY